MPTGSVTKRSVDALSAGQANVFLWDTELRGFGVKVTPSGAKSYVFAYRLGGREATKKRYTIGRHGSPWTPVSARLKAEKLAAMVGDGTDPMVTDKERRKDAVDLRFGDYAERFITAYPTLPRKSGRPRSPRWTAYAASILRREEAVKAFKGKTIKDIKKTDVASFLDTLGEKPALRRNASAVLRQVFAWAVERGDIPMSPLIGSKLPASVPSRDRVLSDDELALIWRAAEEIDYPFGPLFRLLIATGQRREEASAIDWRELNQESATWTLPASRAKNGKAHIVPLNRLATAALDAAAPSGEEGSACKWPSRGFVFTTTGKTPVSGHSGAKERLNVRIVAGEPEGTASDAFQPWRVHDIRRTVATGLQRLGVRFEVTEAVLNHVSGAKSGVAGVYQRHDWKEEKRTALDAWGKHVAALHDASHERCSSNVTEIKVRRA